MLTDDVLIFSSDNNEISIKIAPHEAEVKAVEITQLIGRSELAGLFRLEDNIIKAVDLINLATKEADLDVNNKSSAPSESTVVVAKRVDAKLDIEFSDDEMKAFAIITAPYGGNPVDISDLMIILSQHNLTQSLHDNGLDDFIKSGNLEAPGVKTTHHIISGILPINGDDSRFEFLVNTMERRALKPQQSRNGKVNMHELGDILTVKVGSQLIRRHPPTQGTTGLTILGEPLAAVPGQQFEFNIGDGTAISSSDPNMLIATRAGIPRSIDNGLIIDDVLVIDNVDVGFGNVRFEGSVMISGDVCDGLKVISDGDITVGGSVNSAILEAKGNIAVANGIVGKKNKSAQEGFSCKVTAGGGVNAKFIQYCEINSGRDIIAATHILHSTINSGGNVTVKNATGSKGTLFGGSTAAAEKITAVELGGNSGSRTLLTIVGPLPALREKAQLLNKALQKEHQLLKRLLAAHEKVGLLDKGQNKQQLLQQLKKNVDTKIKIVVDLQAKKAINDQAISTFLAKASISSLRSLQHGVQFEIDGHKTITQREHKQTVTRITKGKLLVSPVTKKKAPA
jgi:uncharacterized protein (DUF342 family)